MSNQSVGNQTDASQQAPQGQSEAPQVVPVPPGPTERGQTIAEQLQTQTPHSSQSEQPPTSGEPPEASDPDRQQQQASQQQQAPQQQQELRRQPSPQPAKQAPQDQAAQAPQQPPPQDLGQQQPAERAPQAPPSHHEPQAGQSSHRKEILSESDLAKAQVQLLSAANRTLLDILQVQRGNGEAMGIDDGTVEILERNQLLYERILDGI